MTAPGSPNRTGVAAALDPAQNGFEAGYTKDQLKFAPHILILRQVERLNEAISGGMDPIPPYLALYTMVIAVGADDDEFHDEMDNADDEVEHILAERGSMASLTYVCRYKPVLEKLLVRCQILKVEIKRGNAPLQRQANPGWRNQDPR